MIGMLTGRFAGDADGGCILDVNGVGYLLACSARTLDRLRAAEGAVRVLVETQVRQDAIVLNGFADAAEREAFRALVEVKTVGPQKALVVLSGLSVDELAQAIAFKDRKRLATIKGLGAATANRIIDEPAMQKWAVGRADAGGRWRRRHRRRHRPGAAGGGGGCHLRPGQSRLEAARGAGRGQAGQGAHRRGGRARGPDP